MNDFAPLTPELVAELICLLGEDRVHTDPDRLRACSFDEVAPRFWKAPRTAEAVVTCRSTDEVSRLLAFASGHRIPVTPRGAGTGLSGGAVPAHGGIVLSSERMNRILEVDAGNMTITVQPGVITSEITAAAAEAGFLYAGDPCSGDASCIGGNVAENAGGNKVVKYGATGANVLALEAVLADGRVTRFGGKRQKDVTGLDFVHLLAGSEGTLAVITEITLRLVPWCACSVDLLACFPDTASAVAFVPRIVRETGILPAALELMDPTALALGRRYLRAGASPEDPDGTGTHLIIQLEGNHEELLDTELETVGGLALGAGARQVYVASHRHARERLWRLRKAIPEAVMAFYEWYSKEDVVVPLSEIPALIDEVGDLCRDLGLRCATFGHVGDGNLHVNLLAPAEHPDPEGSLERARLRLYAHVKEHGGTLSGEHGIGLKRRGYIDLFLDPAQLDLIRRVKAAFDPAGILNPGKIVPE